MFTFHFVNFVGQLDIQEPNYEGIPPVSPIFIFYKEKEDLSKHEILRRFAKILSEYDITYLRPYKSITGEWDLDLQELGTTFECLKDSKHLKGQITLEPEYFQTKKIDQYTSEEIVEATNIKFSIYPDDIEMFSSQKVINLPDELQTPLKRFKKDFGIDSKCAFLMMKFEDTPIQKELIEVLKSHLLEKGIHLLRADDKWYADELLPNIKTYMHGCSFGIALFDRVKTEYFNPNVSLEIGYMMALSKPVLLLKDNTMTSLPSDLVGNLYHEYDFQNPKGTIPLALDKWIKDKEI